MPTNEKRGITVKIDADLHAEIKAYLEAHEMTMADFISLAADHELHPQIHINNQGGNRMENMRTLAFQVPESLFQRIKDYLARNRMTQKQFVLGLIEEEIQRDEDQRQNGRESAEDDDPDEDNDLDEDGAPAEGEDPGEEESLDEDEGPGEDEGHDEGEDPDEDESPDEDEDPDEDEGFEQSM